MVQAPGSKATASVVDAEHAPVVVVNFPYQCLENQNQVTLGKSARGYPCLLLTGVWRTHGTSAIVALNGECSFSAEVVD